MALNEKILFGFNIICNKLFFKQQFDNDIKNILIVKLDEIGDMVCATHVFENLNKYYPQSKITLLCKPFVKSLIEHDPYINKICTSIDELDKHYETIVELRGTWKTLFYSFTHKAKYRVSRAEIRLKNKGNQAHEYITNLEIIKPILPLDAIPSSKPLLYLNKLNEEKVNSFLIKNNITKYAVIHAGARSKLRQWSPLKFAEAITYLHNKYQMDIIFSGTEEDLNTYSIIEKNTSAKVHYFTSGFSLTDFAYLCSKAKFYLGNESGPLQIACVYQVPLIALFGPGVPNVFYPQHKQAITLHHILQCNPCSQKDCIQKDTPCIELISVDEVTNAMDSLLN